MKTYAHGPQLDDDRTALTKMQERLVSDWRRRTAEERLRTSLRKLQMLSGLLFSSAYDPDGLSKDAIAGMSEVIDDIIADLEPMTHAPGKAQCWDPSDTLSATASEQE